MKIGRFRIAKQIVNHGIFGEITLGCSVTTGTNKISISCPKEFEKWYPGILFGTTYILEHTTELVDISIDVMDIISNDVDTNNTIISYLTAKAIEITQQVVLKNPPIFDEGIISVIFPK